MKLRSKLLLGIASLLLLLILALRLLSVDDIPIDQLKPIYADSNSEFISIDGMDVHLRQEGEGETLILLHGTGSSLHTWASWVNQLKDSFHIVTLDLPGFGLTGPHPQHVYTTTMYNNLLNVIKDHLNIEQFHIGGNSFGGYIAWNYTLDHPNVVDKLILIDAAGYEHDSPLIFKLIANPLIGPVLKRLTSRSLIESNMEEVYYDDSKITDELIDRYYSMTLREGNRDALMARIKRKDQNRIDRIGEIEAPTLILWGENDEWAPVADAYKFDKHLPNSQLTVLKEVGHLPMEEVPVRSVQVVQSFLLQD